MTVTLEWIGIIAIFLILAMISYRAANVYFKVRISRELMENTLSYSLSSDNYAKTMLVLGDSTGVGVGAARPEDSVAGRLASYIAATYVENYAISGAAVADLPQQVKQAKLLRYDLILIQIGGNDILAFHNSQKTAQELGHIMNTLPQTAQILVMSAGNVGGATLFPSIIRPFHTGLNLHYHQAFGKVVPIHGGTYVNLYEPFWKDPFLRDPNRYLSRDGLHPSTYGYGLWFEKLRKHLKS